MRLEVTDGGTTVVTTPVGFNSLTIPGGGKLSILGMNLIAKPVFAGQASSVGPNTVDVGSVDLTQRLTAGRSHALLVTSGSGAGKNTSVTAWTSSQLTLGDNFAGLLIPNQDTFQIQELPTISDIFGVGGEVLEGGSATTADLVTVRDGAAVRTIYYSSGGFTGVGWRAVGAGATDYGNFQVYFLDGLIMKKRSAGASVMEIGGSVQEHPVTVPVAAGTGFFATIFAAGVTLDNSGLYDAAKPGNSLLGGSATMADTIAFDSDGDGTLESYYYSTGGFTGVGWRKVGGGSTPQGSVEIPSGFGILKRTGSAELLRTPPY
jgi:hypothetical protein